MTSSDIAPPLASSYNLTHLRLQKCALSSQQWAFSASLLCGGSLAVMRQLLPQQQEHMQAKTREDNDF